MSDPPIDPSDPRPVHPIFIPPVTAAVGLSARGVVPQGVTQPYDVLRASGNTDWHAVVGHNALCGIRPANGWAEASAGRLTADRNRITCAKCAARISHLVRL